MSAVSKVLVVGGGIGGLSATIGLRQAGIDVDVVEVNPDWSVYGVGIIQPGNAIRALDAIGLAEGAVAAGFPMRGQRARDREGNINHQMRYGEIADSRYPPQNGIGRPQLHELLTSAATGAGAHVRLGLSVQGIVQRADGVTVTLTDGTSGEYDLVIGADGMNSAVRRMVIDPDVEPEFSGQVCWRCTVTKPPELDVIDMWIDRETGSNSGFVPLSPETMYVLLLETAPATRFADDELPAVFRERLSRFGGQMAEVRDNLIVDGAEVNYRPIRVLFTPAPWYRGRVVLVGDAAHTITPHLGQGAAMAIEDAVVLSEVLASHDSVPDALEAYMDRRLERVKAIFDATQMANRMQMEKLEADFGALMSRTQAVIAQPI